MMNKCKSIRLHHEGRAESNQDRDHLTAQMDDTLAVEIYYRERECDIGTIGAHTHTHEDMNCSAAYTQPPSTSVYTRICLILVLKPLYSKHKTHRGMLLQKNNQRGHAESQLPL